MKNINQSSYWKLNYFLLVLISTTLIFSLFELESLYKSKVDYLESHCCCINVSHEPLKNNLIFINQQESTSTNKYQQDDF